MEDLFIKIPRSFIDNLPNLPNGGIRAMLVMYSKFNEAEEAFEGASIDELVTRTGLKKRAVYNALRHLEDREWTERKRESSGQRRSAARIRVLLPPDENAPAADALHDGSDDPTAQTTPIKAPGVPHEEETAVVADVVATDRNDQYQQPRKDLHVGADDLSIFHAAKDAYRPLSTDELNQLRKLGANEKLLHWIRLLKRNGGVDAATSFSFFVAGVHSMSIHAPGA